MDIFQTKTIRLLCLFFYFATIASFAEVRLPKLIGDGMILQRDVPVKIWGWAATNEQITVHFIDSDYQTKADNEGNWQIILPAQNVGGPYTMTIEASNSITIQDILFGDVWVCSGQSNMELPVRRVAVLYEQEIAAADYPQIRQFLVPQRYNFKEPQNDFESGQWTAVNPNTVLDFSAVAYFFAKEIYEHYRIPIGLINNALGGSPVEAWISEEAIRAYPEYYGELQRFKNNQLIESIITQDRQRINAWYNELYQKDEGYATIPWYSAQLNTSDWRLADVPGYWEMKNDHPLNGVMWFRKNFDLPDSLVNKPAKLILGCIVDADSVYINEQFVGTTSYQYPPRRYNIPAGILKKENNSLVVRVISNSGRGGFVEDKFYGLDFGKQQIPLNGNWLRKLGAQMAPLQGETFIRWKPTGLYNAMLAPLLNYPIKGVLWYQGESNTGKPLEYRDLFARLINNWRTQWKQGDFPFLYVQLANFMKSYEQPTESQWAELRESQLKTLMLPHTGMAVAIDIGEWNDIHPLNKKDLAKRLALAAEKTAYGENELVYSGPIYQSMQIEGNKIILSFTHTGSGLMVKGDKLNAFALSGDNQRFVWANAIIEKDKVIVWNNDIARPVAVRYAWADNPDNANLYNKEGLPASPFRTEALAIELTK